MSVFVQSTMVLRLQWPLCYCVMLVLEGPGAGVQKSQVGRAVVHQKGTMKQAMLPCLDLLCSFRTTLPPSAPPQITPQHPPPCKPSAYTSEHSWHCQNCPTHTSLPPTPVPTLFLPPSQPIPPSFGHLLPFVLSALGPMD